MTALGRLRTAAANSALLDLVLAGVVLVALVGVTWAAPIAPDQKVAGSAIHLGVAIMLWLRRRIPVVTGVAVSALAALYEFLIGELGGVLLAPLLIAFYSVGAYTEWRGALVGFALTYGATVLGLFADPNVRNVPENALFVLLVAGATWASGRAVRASRGRSATLADLAAQLERERDEKARLAVAAERGRIARELHDVVAHGISIIAVQAGAGRHALGSDPGRARAAFAAIEDTARLALVEMRHMLGLLRDRNEPIASAPLPGLADYGQLIEQARADGVSVDVDIVGDPRPLAPGVDLAAYRIIQEALTNIRKHAPTARAEVRIQYAPTELEIDVHNSGSAVKVSGPRVQARGYGLIGIRERVAMYGGTLAAGPVPEGGFRITARLPLESDGP